MILLPTNSCNIIDEVTIGPIPNVIIEPNLEPKTISKNSNLAIASGLTPHTVIEPKTKNKTNITKDHLAFSLKVNLCTGSLTVGI